MLLIIFVKHIGFDTRDLAPSHSRANMKRIRKVILLMKNASASRNIIGQCIDLLLHKLRLNTGLRDYYFYEFYKSDLTWEQKSRYTSARQSRYWIFENNPFKYQILFTDKYVQKSVLTGLGIRTPELIALIGAGGTVSSLQSFQAVIDRAPREFVFKPFSARGGRGFRRIIKKGDALIEGDEPIQIDVLWQSLQPDVERGILLEEVAHNVDVIQRMNPSSLNTFRVITFHFPETGWSTICSYLKVGRENSVVDNRIAGGLLIRVGNDGMTTIALDPLNRSEHSHHPDTGVALAGKQIEGFQDLNEFAVDASAHFSQMGALGWDIALTDDGPSVIEVNASPAVNFSQLLCGALVTDEMTQVLKPRNLFSRYRKTHMYPNHLRDRKGRI
jgi:hypothetical protein